MLETVNHYTPAGIDHIINSKNRELKELHDKRIAAARRQQNEHPRYMAMTQKEFKNYIIEYIRWNLSKADRIKQEIKELEELRRK